MSNIRGLTGLIILACFLANGLGCGENQNRLEVHPVKGTIHYKGEPMKGGGSILLFPMGAGGKEVSGTIKEDGTFTLKTYERDEGEGAPVGQYRVVIYQVTMQEPESSPEQESTGEATQNVAAKDQIPQIYSNPARSPIITEVKVGENDLKIELEANPNAHRGA